MGEVMALGFPPFAGCATKAPFDILGDTLRGTKGVIVDMFRCPEKVLAACDRLVQIAVDWPLKRKGDSRHTPLLHPPAQGCRRLHERRAVPHVLLADVAENPGRPRRAGHDPVFVRRRPVQHQTRSDHGHSKGDVRLAVRPDRHGPGQGDRRTVPCIQGNVPFSLMHVGTAEEVAEQTRKLIDVAGKDGGFILDVGAVADEGKDENLRGWSRPPRSTGSTRSGGRRGGGRAESSWPAR